MERTPYSDPNPPEVLLFVNELMRHDGFSFYTAPVQSAVSLVLFSGNALELCAFSKLK